MPDLIDPEDGENRAVRSFLACYGGACGVTVIQMRDHMIRSGFPFWPAWAEPMGREHLTKGGAQDWLRHLFALESTAAAPQHVEALQGLRNLKVLLGTDSPEVRGWAPAVQQAAQKAINRAIRALGTASVTPHPLSLEAEVQRTADVTLAPSESGLGWTTGTSETSTEPTCDGCGKTISEHDRLLRCVAPCLTCAANHYCPEHNPAPDGVQATLKDQP